MNDIETLTPEMVSVKPSPTVVLGTTKEWEEVRLATIAVTDAYSALVTASDKLAHAMLMNSDVVLGNVLPNRAALRRKTSRISEWVVKQKAFVFCQHNKNRAKIAAKQAKDDLIKKLNLTEEQLNILRTGD